MTKIPMGPVLVCLVGPSGAGKSRFAEQFSPAEVVSTDALRLELAGDHRRQDMNDQVMREFDRRISLRLELGLRVVADATHLRDTARKRTANLAKKYGAKLIYVVLNRSWAAKQAQAGWRDGVMIAGKDLISYHEEIFLANERKILNGDGLGITVIDTRRETSMIVHALRRDNEQAPLQDLMARGYHGILGVGDIHGNVTGLQKMIDLARSKRLFLLSLGDVVDYAPGTLTTADMLAELMFYGEAVAIFGNHERKILRWIMAERTENGFLGELSMGNDVTVNQLKALPDSHRLVWETRFIGMCALMPHFYRMPMFYFVHGAANKYMIDSMDSTVFRFTPRSAEESFACYGQTSGLMVNGYKERIYDWVREIPSRMTIVVGHDCRCATEPYIDTGLAGGRAVFLDTGSSKSNRFPNGRLSAMALDIEHRKKSGYLLSNERYYAEVDL